MKYEIKPVTVEAVKWTGSNTAEVLSLVQNVVHVKSSNDLFLRTITGPVFIHVGDYVYTTGHGHFKTMRTDCFEQIFTPVNTATET